jgi:hypothetical protein
MEQRGVIESAGAGCVRAVQTPRKHPTTTRNVKREIYHGELESICAIVRGYQRMRGRVHADAAHVEVVGGASV